MAGTHNLIDRLGPKERRGSKPRCHWMTHGSAVDVAARLTALVTPWATVSASDRWMPEGFERLVEAQLHQAPWLLDTDICRALATWWLPPGRSAARTPNFDIASTCTIAGRRGLLLIEAKAHDNELETEAVPRRFTAKASEDRKASHGTIRKAIEDARVGLAEATSLEWRISRDLHYQMSNRFAWSWKLTELGLSVVLVYLGFLNAGEMLDRGRPFSTHQDWENLVLQHSVPLFPKAIWNRAWTVNGASFVPLIRSAHQRFDRAGTPDDEARDRSDAPPTDEG